MTNNDTKSSLELKVIEQGPEKLICPICGHIQYDLPDCEQCLEMMEAKKSNKLLQTIIICLLIVIIFFALIIKNKDGNSIISLDENNNPQFTQPNWLKTRQEVNGWVKEGKNHIKGGVSVHKWQDKNGVWHYSQQAPGSQTEDNRQSEIINIDLETNVVPSQKK